MTLIPSFSFGFWNAWIFMSIFLVQMAAILFADPKVRQKSALPAQAKRNARERYIGLVANLLWLVALILSIFLPFKLCTGWFYSGLILFGSGLTLLMAATYQFFATPVDQLIINGIYRFSRHPLYLATFLICLGAGIAAASWIFVALIMLMTVCFHQEARLEERYCLEKYGDDYRFYRDRVPMWFGIPGKDQASSQDARKMASMKPAKPGKAKNTRLASVIFVVIFIPVFLLIYKQWALNWGANRDEIHRSMPGDDSVLSPAFNATRAVTIAAPPEDVWPWIVQIGYKRAGFYSYDNLDNDSVPSANCIIPAYQDLQVGDLIPMSGALNAQVTVLEPEEFLVMVFQEGPWRNNTWAWGLYEMDDGQTRLVTRLRVRETSRVSWVMLNFLEIIMMRKCMLGIKDRAEMVYNSID
jgi:protein-S-isoprenylcysteine O-methyltransferase Ste14